MKVAVLTSRYPTQDSPYNHMFVHTRNKWYKALGLVTDIAVFVPGESHESYEYEGIQVFVSPVSNIIKALGRYDISFLHLLHFSYRRELDGGAILDWMLKNQYPFMLFIHGVESQSIKKSRPEDIDFMRPKSLLRWIYRDYYLLRRFSKALRKICLSESATLITPSWWMAKDVLFNTGVDITGRVKVIPNGIDTELFSYNEGLWQNGRKALSIRPLYFLGKYAVDLVLKTAAQAKDIDTFSLYGDGPDRELIKEKVQQLVGITNFNFSPGFLPNNVIPRIHCEHSIYYAVTRMDAQGVSMCEAMSSGLPVVTFDVCAIPEFVAHGVEGFVIDCYDTRAALASMYELWESRNLFDRMSLAARNRAELIDIRRTSASEIELASLTISRS